MSIFKERLTKLQPDTKNRRWLFVPYDQLSDAIGPLSREDPKSLGIVLVESAWKAARRPYHQQKLAMVISNLRHFALEQASKGVAVRHVVTDTPYATALAPIIAELGSLRMMTPAERELGVDLQPLVKSGGIELVPHEGWVTSSTDFEQREKQSPPWKMDAFYREIRRKTGILMVGKKPDGGKFSHDADNRLAWKGTPPAPRVPSFPSNAIKEEVGRLIRDDFSHHPGRLNLDRLPCTREDAQTLWQWAKKECLLNFGPYEDAMSKHSRGLFHTRISALINLHRLLPYRCVQDTVTMDLPLASKEGFIRQVIGWREFVHHVHVATDGFRNLPHGRPPGKETPGDGGYQRWKGHVWKIHRFENDPDGGAAPSYLENKTPLPPAFWGETSGFYCLDQVVSSVWEEGYSHHITRLMILANLATLLDVSPRELTDWFWVAYTDAYDWVVEPNVLGMGTYALGDLMTTKPYVSGTPYIQKMSDYCGSCAFDPKKNCPISRLYWAFLSRHAEGFRENLRMKLPLATLKKRSKNERLKDDTTFKRVKGVLLSGERVTPEKLLT